MAAGYLPDCELAPLVRHDSRSSAKRYDTWLNDVTITAIVSYMDPDPRPSCDSRSPSLSPPIPVASPSPSPSGSPSSSPPHFNKGRGKRSFQEMLRQEPLSRSPPSPPSSPPRRSRRIRGLCAVYGPGSLGGKRGRSSSSSGSGRRSQQSPSSSPERDVEETKAQTRVETKVETKIGTVPSSIPPSPSSSHGFISSGVSCKEGFFVGSAFTAGTLGMASDEFILHIRRKLVSNRRVVLICNLVDHWTLLVFDLSPDSPNLGTATLFDPMATTSIDFQIIVFAARILNTVPELWTSVKSRFKAKSSSSSSTPSYPHLSSSPLTRSARLQARGTSSPTSRSCAASSELHRIPSPDYIDLSDSDGCALSSDPSWSRTMSLFDQLRQLRCEKRLISVRTQLSRYQLSFFRLINVGIQLRQEEGYNCGMYSALWARQFLHGNSNTGVVKAYTTKQLNEAREIWHQRLFSVQ